MPSSYRHEVDQKALAMHSALGLYQKTSQGGFLRFVLATLSKTLIIEQSYMNDAVVMYYYLFITTGSTGS